MHEALPGPPPAAWADSSFPRLYAPGESGARFAFPSKFRLFRFPSLPFPRERGRSPGIFFLRVQTGLSPPPLSGQAPRLFQGLELGAREAPG